MSLSHDILQQVDCPSPQRFPAGMHKHQGTLKERGMASASRSMCFTPQAG